MNNKHINFLFEIKKKYKNNDVIITNDVKLNDIELYGEITKYILYLWYYDTNDERIKDFDYIIIPKNINRDFTFVDLDYLDISKIFAFIKYNLFNYIDDILDYDNLNEKNLKKFKVNDYINLLNNNNIKYEKLKTKKDYIRVILENKDNINIKKK